MKGEFESLKKKSDGLEKENMALKHGKNEIKETVEKLQKELEDLKKKNDELNAKFQNFTKGIKSLNTMFEKQRFPHCRMVLDTSLFKIGKVFIPFLLELLMYHSLVTFVVNMDIAHSCCLNNGVVRKSRTGMGCLKVHCLPALKDPMRFSYQEKKA